MKKIKVVQFDKKGSVALIQTMSLRKPIVAKSRVEREKAVLDLLDRNGFKGQKYYAEWQSDGFEEGFMR